MFFKDKPRLRKRDTKEKVMLEKASQKTKKRNGQLVQEIGTLPLSGTSCPACPEVHSEVFENRRACPEAYAEVFTGRRHSLKIFSQRGQQILEYAAVMLAIVAAFGVMRIYAERGLQAHIKSQADQIGLQNESFEQSYDDGYDRTTVTKDMGVLSDGVSRKNSTGLASSYNSLTTGVSKGVVDVNKTELISVGYY